MPYTPPTQLQGITNLTVLADIKPGLIPGIFDSRSYTWRLRQVLTLLDAARRANREAAVEPSPLEDSVARLRGIHSFSFTILPSHEEYSSPDRLLLNVIFDGGWEPYMRIIWGPLGSLLDLLFCHCDSYPLARESGYQDYIRWVREHEVSSQFFYVDSPGTVADRAFLERIDALLRKCGDQADFDLQAVRATLNAAPPPLSAEQQQRRPPMVVATSLRLLKTLHGMRQFYSPSTLPGSGAAPGADAVLLRFARDFLPELRKLVNPVQTPQEKEQLSALQAALEPLRPQFNQELEWFKSEYKEALAKHDRPAPRRDEVQAGILGSLKAPDDKYTRGALVLVRVADSVKARNWLRLAAGASMEALITHGNKTGLEPQEVACTVAVTYGGLRRLGFLQEELERLPKEFIQGMEARAGILGDLRGNHPLQWRRPQPWHVPPGEGAQVPIDLSLVHLVLQLRTWEEPDEAANRHDLLERLRPWIEQKLDSKSGLEVLAVEPAWARPRAEPAPRDLLGFADGISQPSLPLDPVNKSAYPAEPSPTDRKHWDNKARIGEVLLGWANDRGDEALPEEPARWTDRGTFLVVRKIRQFVNRFNDKVEQAAAKLVQGGVGIEEARELVRAGLMGRHSDGTPLVKPRSQDVNEFDFQDDPEGLKCPFASHVRRANPRSDLPGARPPRIVRRGMSYGPAPDGDGDQKERGVIFMAYNASIAEQFEVIQRWLTGGNSSGVCSTHADPFLSVPHPNIEHIFRFVHDDRVHRINLGQEPMTQLQWGLYAFVPSMKLLQEWPEPVAASTSQPGLQTDARTGQVKTPSPDTDRQRETEEAQARAEAKALFEDDEKRSKHWGELLDKQNNGARQFGRTVVVGGYKQVLEVLRDTGTSYSARGYADRMEETLGRSPFGEDHSNGNASPAQALVPAIKDAIEQAVSEEEAYYTAYQWTKERIDQLWQAAQARKLQSASIEIVALGTGLVERLCEAWFGVAYTGSGPVAQRGGLASPKEPVRCPGHFLPVARYVFSTHPNDTVKDMAKSQGPVLRAWIAEFVAANSNTAAPVLKALLEVLKGQKLGSDEVNGIVANVMLGLPPTTLGSWGKVLRAWTIDRTLWQLQHDLLLAGSGGNHRQARDVLLGPVLTTMAADPVADGIWRTVMASKSGMLGKVALNGVEFAWLGLGSALKEASRGAPPAELEHLLPDLLFGGSRDPKSPRHTPHACPGRQLALGALLGAIEALLRAGTLAAPLNPLVLELSRP